MTSKYDGTETYKCLKQAFAAESEARNKYTYFASKATKEGYMEMADIFLMTAENEKEHAKLWYKELNDIGCTRENLENAACSEHHEWTEMYENYASIAESEGFLDLAKKFRQIASIEKEHEMRFRKLLVNMMNCEVFRKSEIQIWECKNCGHIVVGTMAPVICPVCNHPQGYFHIKKE